MPVPSLGLEELAPDSRCSTLVMSKAETNGFGVPDFQNKSTYMYIYIYRERSRYSCASVPSGDLWVLQMQLISHATVMHYRWMMWDQLSIALVPEFAEKESGLGP